MAKDKDRAQNPAAAQRKAEKQKALKKGKAAVAAQRTERYASRNPHRLESQIADLHALRESQGGKLSARDQRQLEDAEKDVARVKKAREVLGDKAPTFNNAGRGRGDGGRGRGRGRGGYEGLGKRGRGNEEEGSEGEETDESVRRIPWPRDTPPPIPRPRRENGQNDRATRPAGTNANLEPLGAERRSPPTEDAEDGGQVSATTTTIEVPSKSAVKTTYESAPQVRDLKKEATARFVPAAVRKKIDAKRGKGGVLLEEDVVERLEREGYGGGVSLSGDRVAFGGDKGAVVDAAPVVEEVEEDAVRRLREEEERFETEMEMEMEEGGQGSRDGLPRGVGIEEIRDEDL